MNYYDKNNQEFIDSTLDLDLTSLYKPFLKEVKAGGAILDIGCGPGRDLKYFVDHGYKAEGVEPSSKLAGFAREHSGCVVHEGLLQDVSIEGKFDGIWACASLLHVPSNELKDVFSKISDLMNEDAVFYCSFKYGEFEGERKGRFFNDQTLETIKEFLPHELTISKDWVTEDKRPDRDERWLNLILKNK
ncbi:class I SAM-dependent methyltransferase [Halobacteriovorax vibrionivorans]|uniref:Class I SAM-dependent methyltransferase n=1 Tax=Halobacteriovorax vibrionivorans TaxID=2152716 RepID=A0ABY0IJH1_9BACT|nr:MULTISPECIES: class I SAM-dependent methyltransferase [Halobacteriovorax]RZF21699.1 class I SAM-dependent methyltransferase [Halobacteriovorax vibrionivorans]TGD49008.1 class I SAM-dependent methyltransferase [Halobacteriovorax sp. Y22]